MRNPQAVFNRCMWWAGITSWPDGTDSNDESRCVDRAFGSTSGRNNQFGLRSLTTSDNGQELPGSTFLRVVALIAVAYILYEILKAVK